MYISHMTTEKRQLATYICKTTYTFMKFAGSTMNVSFWNAITIL